jgi:hypothetical protein
VKRAGTSGAGMVRGDQRVGAGQGAGVENTICLWLGRGLGGAACLGVCLHSLGKDLRQASPLRHEFYTRKRKLHIAFKFLKIEAGILLVRVTAGPGPAGLERLPAATPVSFAPQRRIGQTACRAPPPASCPHQNRRVQGQCGECQMSLVAGNGVVDGGCRWSSWRGAIRENAFTRVGG